MKKLLLLSLATLALSVAGFAQTTHTRPTNSGTPTYHMQHHQIHHKAKKKTHHKIHKLGRRTTTQLQNHRRPTNVGPDVNRNRNTNGHTGNGHANNGQNRNGHTNNGQNGNGHHNPPTHGG